MSEKLNFRSIDIDEENPFIRPSMGGNMTADATARRRMLLKTLGKGSAIVAASVPLQSLASTALLTPNGLRCSVSGMQSSVHSQSTSDSVACGGYAPSHWGEAADPATTPSPKTPKNSWPPETSTLLCIDKFGKCSSEDSGVIFKDKTLFNVMNEAAFANTKTRHWIGAFLNGFNQSATRFPYSAQEILDFYNLDSTVKDRAAAYTLITTYLETNP